MIGLFTSLMTGWFIFTSEPTAYITGQCIGYSLTGLARNLPPNLDFLAYFTPVVLSFFISSFRQVKMTGALIFSGLFISHVINKEASTSVWCFFAALASLNVAYNVWSENRNRGLADLKVNRKISS